MYYTYMLRCKDNSIYSGITTNVERRFIEHQTKNEKCAKYTLNHSVEKIEAVWETADRSSASKLEYNLKKLTKAQKESLIKDKTKLHIFLGEKLECDKYKVVK